MDLIIGGAYQGKCTFAAEKYRLTAADICDLAADAPSPARCYVHLEALTRRGQAAEALPLLLAAEDPAVRAALRFVTAETVDAVFAHALTLPKKEAAVEHLAVIGSPAMQEVRHGDQL